MYLKEGNKFFKKTLVQKINILIFLSYLHKKTVNEDIDVPEKSFMYFSVQL